MTLESFLLGLSPEKILKVCGKLLRHVLTAERFLIALSWKRRSPPSPQAIYARIKDVELMERMTAKLQDRMEVHNHVWIKLQHLQEDPPCTSELVTKMIYFSYFFFFSVLFPLLSNYILHYHFSDDLLYIALQVIYFSLDIFCSVIDYGCCIFLLHFDYGCCIFLIPQMDFFCVHFSSALFFCSFFQVDFFCVHFSSVCLHSFYLKSLKNQ